MFKKYGNTLRRRIASMEEILGYVWAKDTYGDYEHTRVDKDWGYFKMIDSQIEELQKKVSELEGKAKESK